MGKDNMEEREARIEQRGAERVFAALSVHFASHPDYERVLADFDRKGLTKEGAADSRSLLDSGEEQKCPECGGSKSGLTPFFCGVCKGSGRATPSPALEGREEQWEVRDQYGHPPYSVERGTGPERHIYQQGLRSRRVAQGMADRLNEATAEPSGVTTDPASDREVATDEDAYERGRASRQGEIDALEAEVKSLHARFKKKVRRTVR